MLAVEITEEVERELPEIYETYVVVVQNSVQYRYEDFRELARTKFNQPDWTCKAIERFCSTPSQGM
jgi:hypothetical protein